MSTHAELYDQDLYAWTQEQAARLQEDAVHELGLEHLIEDCGRAFTGNATLQRGYWSWAGARRSQENAQALLWRCTRSHTRCFSTGSVHTRYHGPHVREVTRTM